MSTRLLGRTGRASGLLLHVVPDGTRNPIASGQTPTFTRTTDGGFTAGISGRVSRTVHSQLKYEMVDLDGDGIRETMGLLLEPSRTNAFTRSQEFDNAAWTKSNVTIAANVATAPDGTLTADKIVETVATATHFVQRATPTLADSTYSSFSVWMKAGERTWGFIYPQNKAGASPVAYFDLVNGVVGNVGADCRARIEKYVDGWYRCIVAFDAKTGGSTPFARFGPTTGNGAGAYAGDVTKGIYAWGAQMETDRAVASSYVATVASTVAKNADALSFVAGWEAQPNITVYAKLARPWWADIPGTLDAYKYLLRVGDANTFIEVYASISSRNIGGGIKDGTTNAATTTPIPAGDAIEVCVQFVDLFTAARLRVDVGAGFGSYSSAVGPVKPNTTGVIGQSGGGANVVAAPLLSLKVASGARTMAEMRGLV